MTETPRNPRNPATPKDLYPTPKTYEQRLADVGQREQWRRARRPRWVALRAGAGAALLFYASVILLMRLEGLWASGVPGVASSFAIASVLFVLMVFLSRFVREACEKYDCTPILFLFVWSVSLLFLANAALTWLSDVNVAWIALVHGVLSGGMLGIVLGVARYRERASN